MKKHSDLLRDDWDLLIVLDACRYDIFKEVVSKQFSNCVTAVNSEASSTMNWLLKHWKGKKRDITYISANPYINSRGVHADVYDARKYFYRVIDSWDLGFDKKTGRVLPVAPYFDYVFEKGTHRKIILHFMQPHAPYIFKSNKRNLVDVLKTIIPIKKHIKLYRKYIKVLKYIPFIRNIDFHTDSSYGNRYNKLEIKEAYIKNLEDVLPYVYKIIDSSKGIKIVVTSDHAEYLGENGRFGHGGKLTELISTVPYLEVRT